MIVRDFRSVPRSELDCATKWLLGFPRSRCHGCNLYLRLEPCVPSPALIREMIAPTITSFTIERIRTNSMEGEFAMYRMPETMAELNSSRGSREWGHALSMAVGASIRGRYVTISSFAGAVGTMAPYKCDSERDERHGSPVMPVREPPAGISMIGSVSTA